MMSEPEHVDLETPADPGDIGSAARSCSALLVLLLALVLIICVSVTLLTVFNW